MAYTQADIDALDREIITVRTVQSTSVSDQSTTFRSLDELLKLRTIMQQEVNQQVTGRSSTRYAATSKGV